jgi:catalase
VTELPDALPKLLPRAVKPEVQTSEVLSLLARLGTEGIKTLRIAIMVADGVDGQPAMAIHESLAAQAAVPRFVAETLGKLASATGDPIDVEVSTETAPSVLWDALIVPNGEQAAAALSNSGHAKEFLKDQYRHCKTILLLCEAASLLQTAGIPEELASGAADPGLLFTSTASWPNTLALCKTHHRSSRSSATLQHVPASPLLST